MAGLKQVQIFYGSGTVDKIASGHQVDAARALTRWQHFSAGNDVVYDTWKWDIISEIRLRQSMHIYIEE